MSEFRILKSIDVLLSNGGHIYIEEALGGGHKITIDTHSENTWLGFKSPEGMRFLHWDVVKRLVKEHETTR